MAHGQTAFCSEISKPNFAVELRRDHILCKSFLPRREATTRMACWSCVFKKVRGAMCRQRPSDMIEEQAIVARPMLKNGLHCDDQTANDCVINTHARLNDQIA